LPLRLLAAGSEEVIAFQAPTVKTKKKRIRYLLGTAGR
jgi:hypothetical protein